MSNSTYLKALDIISRHRVAAMSENDRRTAEINEKIPAIEEINIMLSQTNIEILKIMAKGENVKENMKQLERKNLEAQGMIKQLLVENGYPENYLEIQYRCKKCKDTGLDGIYKCSCLDRLAGKLAVEELNEISPLKLCSFDSFSLEYYRGVSTSNDQDCYSTMEGNLEYCMRYTENFSKHSNSLFISGRTGLGKTHISLAIAERLLSENWNVVYGSAINLMNRIEDEHFGRAKGETLSVLLEADLLIIDDLGTEYDKQFCISTLYDIINTRLNRNIPTIISTNLNFQEMERRYEARIVSRILSNYTYLKFTGNDVRQKKRLQTFKNIDEISDNDF